MSWVKKAEIPTSPPEWPAFGDLMDFVDSAAKFITVERFWAAVEAGVTGKTLEEVMETAPPDLNWNVVADYVTSQVNAGWEPQQIVNMVRDEYPEIL